MGARMELVTMFKRIKIPFFALALTSMTLCGFWCEPIDEDMGPFSIEDCVDYYRYIIYLPSIVDTVDVDVYHEGNFSYELRGYNGPNRSEMIFWGPPFAKELFDSLTLKISFLCNNQWLESRDYKFLNRKDAFTHIDYKEQEEGELMFDAELDSICPGLSNYRITQYTDSECLEELNSK